MATEQMVTGSGREQGNKGMVLSFTECEVRLIPNHSVAKLGKKSSFTCIARAGCYWTFFVNVAVKYDVHILFKLVLVWTMIDRY
jgi:hypothetical protein